ncbi:phosphoribosylamine-glycine ligase / phosphoribosylformylglycinamidine cyclo-ligase [Wickerhamomyces ciferrii]|uniref:Phosphoribosylamine-glycine ligase / phosphoribosylformylglycinamidine cyclo-ligase n=1 Tax=Wickerhamomyces ciferrii (strain ATCC 14091 / BCRC 22168 / CBS 111 / JCM 3599 / NBRC 0793 / NRRL Y-1031 F-60-10) TaxID=1206466 RepID=K0KG75_WICCF|nr:phosphoribosylamine-glycine ligase / phosphoribosylformylglycinamidine cyclo-ligase [Wickerhamomyces ciferrii]CCH44160.1 phosphoribosylamine-glycine ligase / phosphoribosylformylglycinamidine cyclo-ligase [Wickerhamomyces ciferrii]
MSLNILVVGNGGREHALIWKLSQSKLVNHIYVAPGNGGTDLFPNVTNINIGSSKKEFPELANFAQENDIGLVVPGPEQPLVEGITTVFTKIGIPVFGPSEKAAVLEGSKAFSKDFMAKHNIPTAEYKNFKDFESAKAYIQSVSHNVVIKADGLAAGKGVLIPQTKQEAIDALTQVIVDKEFGDAGNEVVVEEFLEGDEISILTIADGYSWFNLPPAQDHKRIGDGDSGLNTGGMGAYAPAPVATAQLQKQIDETIIKPSIEGFRKDGFPFKGVLFTGIIITATGPKVLEYNVRFGDPETQTVLPLLTDDTDLAEVMLAAAEGRLDSVKIDVKKDQFATTVVMSAGGYPESYKKGDEIIVEENSDSLVFHAGTTKKDGKILTNGGRVIASTASASNLKDAVAKAYAGVEKINFEGKYNRKDIAHRAFRDADSKANGITYAAAGVSVDNGNLLVENIKKNVKSTKRPGADSDIGGFGGIFDLKAAGYKNTDDTLLVAATDGVGTKLRIAQILNIHDTVGIDLVAMNVNDLVVQGAEPLIFLDYFATGKLDIKVAADFVKGVADGCIQAGCALVGGETSEMPGMYEPGHYDTNGTAVGAVLKNKILPAVDRMSKGNVLLGLKSDGVHSNGFSLVRKIIETYGYSYTDSAPWKPESTIGKEVLTPTRIYVKQLLKPIQKDLLLGLAHITGGGLVENIPRALPSHLSAKVDLKSFEIPEIFKWFGKTANVPIKDLLKTFNLGIGMVAIVEKENVDQVKSLLEEAGETVYQIGELIERGDDAGTIVENSEGLY